ncbi:phosphopantetheine-binding protein [Streptomyces sp. NPDC001966]
MTKPQRQAPWDDRFEQILRSNLNFLAADTPLDDDASLSDLGLDSMQTVALLVELEKAYEIAFPDEALTAETFATAGNLWTQVEATARHTSTASQT